MSQYDQLRTSYSAWRQTTQSQWQLYRSLAPAMATAFEQWLGCPQRFALGEGSERYVSPASTVWMEESGTFHMQAYDGPPPPTTFHSDGLYYFALRLFLEQAAQQSEERDAFWFLLSARQKNKSKLFDISLQQTGQTFVINAESGEGSDILFEHMLATLTTFLCAPDIHPQKSPFRIGFIAT